MSITISTRPYDHSRGASRPGDSGIVLDAETGYTGYAFSTRLPAVFIAKNGDVGCGEVRLPAEDMLAWLDQIAATIRRQTVELRDAGTAEA